MIDGIAYTLYAESKQATVVAGETKYTGSVVIPESVVYNNGTYSVTSIGYSAFGGCSSLANIEIPNSVASIGNYAFQYCSGLSKGNIAIIKIGEKSVKIVVG